MRRHWTVIVLAVIALGMALYLWRDQDKVSETEKQSRVRNLFSAWRREDLSRVEIAHEGETIILVRDAKTDSSWRMTSPRQERVDQAAAERLLTTLEFAVAVRKVDPNESLGLASPRASGSVTMGNLVMKFALGAQAPRPEGSSYFRTDDNPPVVASKELTEALLAPSDSLRDRTVVPYLSLDIARFEVRSPQNAFVITRKDDRTFVLADSGTRTSRAVVDKVWGALAEIRAESFPKDADADRLTANPSMTILMTSKDGKPGELVFGAECPGHPNDVVVLRKAPSRVAACAPKGAQDMLLGLTPAALVDLHAFSFHHDEIEELRLEELGTENVIEVARKGKGFHERLPKDRELLPDEAESVSELLERIELGAADETTAPGPFTAKYKARATAAGRDDTIEIGELSANAPRIVAHRVNDDRLLLLPRAYARLFIPRATTLRSRKIVEKEAEVKHVGLRCGVAQDLEDQGSGYRLVDPKGYPTDGSITQLVDAVEKGKALLWVADDDDGTFGFGSCKVTLDGFTLSLGKKAEGGVYGRIEKEVFLAPVSLDTLARRIYVDHGALRVEAAAIATAKVNGKPVESLAAADLVADHVVKLGSSDPAGGAQVEIVLTLGDGGKDKRITCGPALTDDSGIWRQCVTSDVKAVFAVQAARIDRLLGAPDAGSR